MKEVLFSSQDTLPYAKVLMAEIANICHNLIVIH